MKKHIAIAAGVLLTLGTAVAATLNGEAQSMKPVATVESAISMDAKQSAQVRGAVEDPREFVRFGSAGPSALS